MNIQLIMFGGIGSLVETSELQRHAFNKAFEEAGVLWHWDNATYRRLLSTAGGVNRIREYASTRISGASLSDAQIEALHQRKTAIFQQAMRSARLPLRSGVQRLLNAARNAHVKVAIASTTLSSNIEALAASASLDLEDFDLVLSKESVERPKPDPQVYQRCLDVLGVAAIHAIAIEDSDSGVEAAVAAGVRCVALPGENTSEQDFSKASLIVDSLNDVSATEYSPRITGLDAASCQELVAAIR